jgi:RNA polymerase sigma-70 factor (ECF subfamily)
VNPVPNIPDWLPGRWRDFPTASSVPTGMTLALRPRPTWRPSLLAMAAVDPASEPTGPSSSNADEPSRPSSSNADEPSRPDRARPDADVLELRPEQQLAAITRRHADAVYRVALSVTRDPDLAEDVAQDALLKAWQALPSFRSDAPLKNWLLRITHNTAISALRRRREVRVDPDELPEAPTPRHHTLEAQVESRLALDQFEAALADLDELSRAIVVLREVEGLSYDEITEVLDVPLPTVKTRLLRARRQLATALEGWRP